MGDQNRDLNEQFKVEEFSKRKQDQKVQRIKNEQRLLCKLCEIFLKRLIEQKKNTRKNEEIRKWHDRKSKISKRE